MRNVIIEYCNIAHLQWVQSRPQFNSTSDNVVVYGEKGESISWHRPVYTAHSVAATDAHIDHPVRQYIRSIISAPVSEGNSSLHRIHFGSSFVKAAVARELVRYLPCGVVPEATPRTCFRLSMQPSSRIMGHSVGINWLCPKIRGYSHRFAMCYG